MSRALVMAGGGVVYRTKGSDTVEYLVIHRPSYDDWTLPKGKVDAGETLLETAVREVEEETGFICSIDDDLGSIGYPVSSGRKVVRYWLMQQQEGTFSKNSEVDQIKWLEYDKAVRSLTFERDREVLRWGARRRQSRKYGRVYLYRHAHAGSRSDWKRNDLLRPLSAKGHKQAGAAVDLLSTFPIARIITSPYLRCIESIEPLAESLDIEPEVDPRLGENQGAGATAELIDETRGEAVLLCSHRANIGVLIEEADDNGADLDAGAVWQKGSVWVLHTKKGRIRSGHYLPPPA